MKNSPIRWIAIAAIGLLIVFFVWQRFSSAADAKTLAEKPATGGTAIKPLPVSVQIMEYMTLNDELSTSGTLEADQEVEIASEISGKVVQIFFQEGASVKQGQLLVKIRDDDLQAQLKKLSLQLDLARQQEKRRKQLLDIGGVSQEEYDQVLTTLNTTEAEVELLKVSIAKTEIRAPFAGKIGFRYIADGSYLAPGTRVAQLVKLNPIKLSFSVPEKYAALLKEGGTVSFSVDGRSVPGQGTIFARDPKIDPATRTMTIKAKVPNGDFGWVPGSFAQVQVPLSSYKNTLVLTSEAVVPESGGQSVFIMEKGQAKSVQVVIGIRKANAVQVIKGLSPGDSVITTGVLQLRSGTAVSMLNQISTPR